MDVHLSWRTRAFITILISTVLMHNVKGRNTNSGAEDMLLILENQSEGGFQKSAHDNDPGSSCNKVVTWTNNENCVVGPVSIRENVAEDVFHQLCPRPTGRFQAPSSCDLYITCHHNQLTINQCPPHFHFDESHQECVEAELYECSFPVKQDPRRIFERNNEKSEIDHNQRLIDAVESDKHSSPNGDVFQDTEHFTAKRFAKCPENYITPHPYECESFQICSNNQIFNQKCGPGTLFNPLSLVCDHAGNVDCSSSMSDYGTYDCQPEHEYVTSHFDDCTKFVECFRGSLNIKSCSHSTVFNPEKGTCDFKYRTECREPLSFQHDTDVNHYVLKKSEENQYGGRAERSPDHELSKYECEFNYIAPVEGVCNEFIECEDKRLYKKTCGPGTAYNPLLGQCDWPYNVRAPDPRYCARFFQCDGRHFVHRACPKYTFFNVFTGKCGPAHEVDCNGKVDDQNQHITLSRNRS